MASLVLDAPRLAGEPPEDRWRELDGWRAAAIIGVLIGHFVQVPGFNAGRFGVELFFVLSGLLMAQLLFVKKTPLRQFLLNRMSRVWPALFVFLAIMVCIFPIPSIHVLGALTFTQNYASINFGFVEVIDHLWSLSVEEWTYILLALLAVVARHNLKLVVSLLSLLVVLMVINGSVQTVLGADYYHAYWRTDVRAASILMGAVAFLLLREQPVPSYVPVATGVAATILNINFVPDPVQYSVGTLFLAVSIATLKQAPPSVLKVLRSRPLGLIAAMSFSLYLWQQPFYKQADKYPPAVLFIAAVVTAAASYHLVEKPSRSFLRRSYIR